MRHKSELNRVGKSDTMSKLKDENDRLKAEIKTLKQDVEVRDIALNLSKILIRITDLEGKILYVNTAHTNLLGYTEAERIGSSTFDVVHPDDKERVVNYFFTALSKIDSNMVESEPIEYRMRHKDGHYLWARAIGRLAKTEGQPDLIVITVWDITESRQMEDQLHALAERLHTIREEERTLISREIHDEFGQALTGLKFELALLAKKISHDNVEALQKAKGMMQSIDETIQLIRRISTDLRPPILDDFGLKAAIEWQAEDFQKKTGIKTTFRSNVSGELTIEKEKAISVFRIFQETLTNIARHAAATEVTIDFRRTVGVLNIQIQDNGRGISNGEVNNKMSLGIMGMKERAFALNGEFSIIPAPQKGTLVKFSMPLN